MNSPEIEYLIEQAVSNRPKVTSSPMNLYLHNGRPVCGARIVMPADAVFIAHLTPEQLQNGFDEKQWKFLVETISKLTGDTNRRTIVKQQIASPQTTYNERRREPRLYYRHQLWFTHSSNNKEFAKGVMCDISSGGLAFTCYCDKEQPTAGKQIITRFEVPRAEDSSAQSMKFDRASRICSVSRLDGNLHRIAVQFANPLPFKPADQTDFESNAELNLQNSAV